MRHNAAKIGRSERMETGKNHFYLHFSNTIERDRLRAAGAAELATHSQWPNRITTLTDHDAQIGYYKM